MVARTPPKQQRKMVVVAPHLSPTLLRETVKKVDKCMARLQELQYTVTGGTKVISGVNLSPRSSRSYFRTSLRCKQESLRIRNANSRRSPPGKLPAVTAEDWRRMSLPAMLLGETMGEVLQATQFARTIVEAAVSSKTRRPATTDDPKTPVTQRRKHKINVENSVLMQARRRREKQVVLQTIRSESSDMPSLQRAKSKINFKVSSPLQNRECDKENCRYIASRVSPRNRPWARKTVLFPNPLFHSSSPTSQNQKFCKTKSPVIARNRQTPHKFLIKSPPDSSKFQVKIKSPPVSIPPTRAAKKSPKASSAAAKMRRSFSPSRLANRLISPLTSRKPVQKNEEEMKFTEIARNRQIAPYKFLIKSPPNSKFQGKIKSSLVSTSPTRTTSLGKKSSPKAAKLRRSFSPSRLANRIASPLKIRNSIQKNEGMTINSGNKRPTYSSTQFSPQRI